MSPFSLIDTAGLNSRAAAMGHSQFRLNPFRLLSALRRRFVARFEA